MRSARSRTVSRTFAFILGLLSVAALESQHWIQFTPGVAMAAEAPPAYSLPLAMDALMFSYAAYCPVLVAPASEWNCYWCKNTSLPLQVTAVLTDTAQNTRGFVGITSDRSRIHVSFRGTQLDSLENWISNLKFAKSEPYPNVPNAEVHSGFFEAYRNVRSQVRSAVSALRGAYSQARIVVNGHSLGAALATFAAIDIADALSYDRIELWNFGDPRCGNQYFSQYFAMSPGISVAYRTVNQADIVPHLPPRLLDFWHIPTEVWFTTDKSFKECDASGEDPTCSDSIEDPVSVYDHLTYLGVHEQDGHL